MNRNLLLIGIAILFCVFISCSSEKPAPPAGGSSSVDQILKGAGAGKAMKSPDGSFEITVPDNWAEEKDLNKDAKIQAAMRMRDVYLVVFVDQKDKYGDIKLEEFAEGSHKKLTKRLTSPVGTSPAHMTVGGLPAIQYQLTGSAEGSTFTYVQTLVEGPVNFYEILAWTPKAQLEKNQFAINEAVKSFKETAK